MSSEKDQISRLTEPFAGLVENLRATKGLSNAEIKGAFEREFGIGMTVKDGVFYVDSATRRKLQRNKLAVIGHFSRFLASKCRRHKSFHASEYKKAQSIFDEDDGPDSGVDADDDSDNLAPSKTPASQPAGTSLSPKSTSITGVVGSNNMPVGNYDNDAQAETTACIQILRRPDNSASKYTYEEEGVISSFFRAIANDNYETGQGVFIIAAILVPFFLFFHFVGDGERPAKASTTHSSIHRTAQDSVGGRQAVRWSASSNGYTWLAAYEDERRALCRRLASNSRYGNSAGFFYDALDAFYTDKSTLSTGVFEIADLIDSGSQALH